MLIKTEGGIESGNVALKVVLMSNQRWFCESAYMGAINNF